MRTGLRLVAVVAFAALLVGTARAGVPESALPPASAPLLDVTGLAIAVIVLGGLAALRLRRRPAKQRQQPRR